MPRKGLRLLVCSLGLCFLGLGASTLARAECLTTVSAMKANHVKTRWRETTENDGKPLIISIADGAGGLVFSGTKAGVPWLNGNVSVCRRGGSIDIELKNPRATNDVPLLTRMGLPSVMSAQIVSGQIKLAGGGWSGTFVGL